MTAPVGNNGVLSVEKKDIRTQKINYRNPDGAPTESPDHSKSRYCLPGNIFTHLQSPELQDRSWHLLKAVPLFCEGEFLAESHEIS